MPVGMHKGWLGGKCGLGLHLGNWRWQFMNGNQKGTSDVKHSGFSGGRCVCVCVCERGRERESSPVEQRQRTTEDVIEPRLSRGYRSDSS